MLIAILDLLMTFRYLNDLTAHSLQVLGITKKNDKTFLKKRIKELKVKHEREKKKAEKMARKQKKGLKSGKKWNK